MKGKTTGKKGRPRIWLVVGVLVALVAMTAAWRWTPLAEQIDIRKITAWAVSLRDNPARSVIILGAYLVGSLVSFPVTLLILATAIVFGPLVGSAYSFAGCLLGAAATYAVGYLMGKSLVQRLAGRKWRRVEKAVGQTGVMAVAALRLLPVAPFTIVNIISGAVKIPVWNYFLGSLIGLAPGIIIINFFTHQFARAVRHPGPGSYALLGASVAVAALGILWLRRKVAEAS
ncbi:MAG TPA: VTT domain-containing protein [Candidatus Binatia bacterium]